MSSLDAIVIAKDPVSRVYIAGVRARERAVRVAKKVGAQRVLVLDEESTREDIAAWRGVSTNRLLVIRADQLVHTPLVERVVEAGGDAAIVVAPDGPSVNDLTAGDYAGAFVVGGEAARMTLEALARGDSDVAIVNALERPIQVPHGDIARAPIRTREERRAAHRLLYRILVKPQDNALTRFLFRPVSYPITRVLVWT